MLEQNLPDISVRLVSVTLPHTRGVVMRVQALMRNGDWCTVHTLECPGGRPTGSQLADLTASMSEEVSNLVVARYGVQGVLVT